MIVALEAMSDELFEQVLCLIVVVGVVVFFLIKAFKGTDDA